MRHALALLVAALFIAGCDGRFGASASSPNPVVRKFGTSSSPDGSMQLVVTRREKSLVDFKVLDSTSGKQLANDYLGSDAMRWFLLWETPARLWGYGSDIGYLKIFEFKPGGTVIETEVDETMAVPPIVWENLPSSLQRKYKAQQVGAPNP